MRKQGGRGGLGSKQEGHTGGRGKLGAQPNSAVWQSAVTQDPLDDPLRKESKVFFKGRTPQLDALEAVVTAVRRDLEAEGREVLLPLVCCIVLLLCACLWMPPTQAPLCYEVGFKVAAKLPEEVQVGGGTGQAMHIDTWGMHTAELIVPLSKNFVCTPLGVCTDRISSRRPYYQRAAESAWRLAQAHKAQQTQPWTPALARTVQVGDYFIIDGSLPHHGPAPGDTPRLGMYMTVHTPSRMQSLYEGRVTTALGEGGKNGTWGVRNLLQDAVDIRAGLMYRDRHRGEWIERQRAKPEKKRPDAPSSGYQEGARKRQAEPMFDARQIETLEELYGAEARTADQEDGSWAAAVRSGEKLSWDELLRSLGRSNAEITPFRCTAPCANRTIQRA